MRTPIIFHSMKAPAAIAKPQAEHQGAQSEDPVPARHVTQPPQAQKETAVGHPKGDRDPQHGGRVR